MCLDGLQSLSWNSRDFKLSILGHSQQYYIDHMQPKRIKTVIVFILIFGVGLFFNETWHGFLNVSSAYSQVQKPKKRKNFFQLLFGNRGSLRNNRNQIRAKRIKVKKRRSTVRQTAKTSLPTVVAVEKAPDAAKILVAGDFIAGSVAWGLERFYKDFPNAVVVDISKGLSGFVRNDVKDWPNTIAEHIDEYKPAAVVFIAGMNDRQQMRLSTGRKKKLSEEWLAEYNRRTQALATAVTAKKVPLIWLGLPPVSSNKMSSDYLAFNQIYKSKLEGVTNTAFVDIWDGFSNEEGRFVSAGPDINGQIKRLRTSDGINMTKTGKQKLAFFAERAISRLTGLKKNTKLASLPGLNEVVVEPQYDPAKTGRTIVYSLGSPALDGATALEGDEQVLPKDDNPREQSSLDLVLMSRKGRVDHYGIVANEAKPWPKDDAAKTAASDKKTGTQPGQTTTN